MVQAKLILESLKQLKVTHVLTVPDNGSRALLDLLWSDREIQVVSVTREGEAFAIAAGLWVGGKIPVILIQNTGLLESGDALRGTVLRMRVPLLCLITCRGYAKFSALKASIAPGAADAELLSRPDLDSIALLTEPTLRAWSIPFELFESDADTCKIADAFRKAQTLEQPVALLLTSSTT